MSTALRVNGTMRSQSVNGMMHELRGLLEAGRQHAPTLTPHVKATSGKDGDANAPSTPSEHGDDVAAPSTSSYSQSSQSNQISAPRHNADAAGMPPVSRGGAPLPDGDADAPTSRGRSTPSEQAGDGEDSNADAPTSRDNADAARRRARGGEDETDGNADAPSEQAGDADDAGDAGGGIGDEVAEEATMSEADAAGLEAAVAGICELVGIGPEDPLADLCATVLVIFVQTLVGIGCAELSTHGLEMCRDHVGC